MIKTISDLVADFAKREMEVLDTYKISHPPTIGDMYEGLTHEILDKTIPPNLSLKIIKGFITDSAGNMSGQIDCMLVNGECEQIPKTDNYKCHVKNVIAVFEVKKTLNSTEIEDSYFHLRDVDQLFGSYLQSGEKGTTFDIEPARRTFAKITGVFPPKHSEVSSLPFDLQMIYHNLLVEQLSPVRIVYGHHGWEKEETLRTNYYKFMDQRESKHGLGVGSFPHLVVGGKFSLIKLNGFPYCTQLIDGKWPFFASSRENPIRLMIELIWTKLHHRFDISDYLEDDLDNENMTACILGKATEQNGLFGWEYTFPQITEKKLKAKVFESQWSPTILSAGQFSIMNVLCHTGEIECTDSAFIEYALEHSPSVEAFIKEITDTSLVAVAENRLYLTTEECLCLIDPELGYVAGENNFGRMHKWLEKRIGKKFEHAKILRVSLSDE